MDPNSDFQKRIVEYLESVHIGEFMTGTMDEVKEQVNENIKAKEYRDPTQTLSDAPPKLTECDCNKCAHRIDVRIVACALLKSQDYC
jgi:hypothetical protein